MPKSSAERTRAWRERKRASEVTVKKVKKRKSRSEIERDSRERRKIRAILDCLNNQDNEPATSTLAQPTPFTYYLTTYLLSIRDNLQYSDFNKFKTAHNIFIRDFINNPFGLKCCVCDRLWFKNDLKPLSIEEEEIIKQKFPEFEGLNDLGCTTCRQALRRKTIPKLAALNGFKYTAIPADLPKLDLVSGRLISPRIPFMQIRRLRHVQGQFGILGQVINVPVSVNTMVNQLPRSIDDDYCINVHIKRKQIYRSSYLTGLINKRNIRLWLKYLLPTPLFQMYDIKVDESFFSEDSVDDQVTIDAMSENILIEESLIAQQYTLLWNDDQYLSIASGEMNVPHNLLFDEHAEELSFPTIYLGQFRNFSKDLNVTPFMMATSELRRSDRRGVTPYHLLYMAMKIMRLRVRDSLNITLKHVGKDTKLTREQIQSEEYIHRCIESNLGFLRCIPNSTWYWAETKRDLFAMIRQLGKPTVFLTMSANEIGWPLLLQILYKLKNNGIEISKEATEQLHFIEKSTLINEDSVTCAIYFNKLINVIMNILQSKKSSPFGKYRVEHYFKRIEFQHRGSPHAHILLWLENAPADALGADKQKAIEMVDALMSVDASEASGNIKLQTHKHTFTCFKNVSANTHQKCRFETPFMPCRYTTILTPMKKEEPEFSKYKKHYNTIMTNLDNNDYVDIDSFYQENQIISDDYYINVLRAGITRPRVFIKRQPMEKWHNPFNPFIFSILKSNMDIQFITEEYSCAAYIMEYVNNTNHGISDLQRNITEIMDEHPEFDIIEITRKMSINIVNTVEITSQEAAWYLLREPMSKSSSVVVYIPTIWPVERQRIRKTQKELGEMNIDDDATNIWKEHWFDKYEKRPEELEDVSLAQFVAYYTHSAVGYWTRRKEPRIIRYRNYDMTDDMNEYKREMVTLYIPFRNEENEILADTKFIQIYDDNETLLLERLKEFSSNVDIQKMVEISRDLYREDELNHDDNAEEINLAG